MNCQCRIKYAFSPGPDPLIMLMRCMGEFTLPRLPHLRPILSLKSFSPSIPAAILNHEWTKIVDFTIL